MFLWSNCLPRPENGMLGRVMRPGGVLLGLIAALVLAGTAGTAGAAALPGAVPYRIGGQFVDRQDYVPDTVFRNAGLGRVSSHRCPHRVQGVPVEGLVQDCGLSASRDGHAWARQPVPLACRRPF